MTSLSTQKIANYLYYSYSPTASQRGLPRVFSDVADTEKRNEPKAKLVEDGRNVFHEVIKSCLNRTATETTHVVPISGGWDSRAILAALAESSAVDNHRIQTVSFGCPGTWDYECGQRIARKKGLNHRAIDLRTVDWSLDPIATYAASLSPTRFFEAYCNAVALDALDLDDDPVVWSGYLGDPLAGSHQPTNPVNDWEAAKDKFASFNHTTELVPTGFDPTDCLPDEPYLSSSALSYEEQLDFAIRQPCFVRPIVEVADFDYRFPFRQRPWVDFMLNVDADYRENRRLFRQLMIDSYPEWFDEPGSEYGQPFTASETRKQAARLFHYVRYRIANRVQDSATHPGENYLNFDAELRRDGELRNTVRELVFSLDEREMLDWVEIGSLWSKQQNHSRDASDELLALSSLELLYRNS